MIGMNKNLIAFCVFAAILIVMSGYCNLKSFPPSSAGPWQLLPFSPLDSLSEFYKENYRIYDSQPMVDYLKNAEKRKVMIMVDAWGVSVEDSILVKDFSYFQENKPSFALHKRLANRTMHAERTELQKVLKGGVFLFGGDSLEYDRKEYVASQFGAENALFCQHCPDKAMVEKLDSVLASDSVRNIAWTTQDSRLGDREKLHATLKSIADLAKKYPESLFIVMGTHRPILGTPETRRLYHPHWVPVVILNE